MILVKQKHQTSLHFSQGFARLNDVWKQGKKVDGNLLVAVTISFHFLILSAFTFTSFC